MNETALIESVIAEVSGTFRKNVSTFLICKRSIRRRRSPL
jgi:hypothetical protein